MAHAAALAHFRDVGATDDAKELSRISHSTTIECYHAARKLIAGQFVGSTWPSLVEDIAAAGARFPVSRDSDTPPDPTAIALNPAGVDLWKILAYAIAVRHAAYRGLEKAGADLDNDRELAGIERAVQLLHMLTQEDIVLADLTDRPLDGQVRPPRRSVDA